MSRLIVKNLPKTITEDKLRQIFSENGTITDIQLKYTPDGKFRRFGFIGFQSEEQSEKAIQSLHSTFINTSKISVEKCALLGDASKPKAWSKYAPDSSAFKKSKKADEKTAELKKPREKKLKKNKEDMTILEKYKDDPMFEEFLQVHGNADKLERLKEKTEISESENDSGTHSEKDESNKESLSDQEELNEQLVTNEKLAEKPISDLEYLKMLKEGTQSTEKDVERKPRQKMEKKVKEKVELFNLKLKDLPYAIKKKDIREFFRPNVPFSIRIPRNIHGIAFVGYKTEKAFKKALLKDKSFIKGKQIAVIKYEVKSLEVDHKDDPKRSKWKNQEESLKNEEDIAESGKIFVRNLAYTSTEKDIEDLFSKYGPVTEVNLPIDSTTRKMKGFGVITFMMPEHAVKAYTELDGSILHGRMLHLLPGKTKDSNENTLEESSNFKKKKVAKQKSEAGSTHNWNSLFLGHDAVAEVVADTYGTSKEAVVGSEGKGSAAVRLALGETQIVAQTRKYLEQEGVVLDVFNATRILYAGFCMRDTEIPNHSRILPRYFFGILFYYTFLNKLQCGADVNHYSLSLLNKYWPPLNVVTISKAPKTRSKTIILVKNLPSRTEFREVREMFQKHGEVARVILPPSGITAIVEFIEPSEARKAFTRLAYSKFKNVPLYLEWAPENSLLENRKNKVEDKQQDTRSGNETVQVSANEVKISEEQKEESEEEEDEPEPDTTLFVKNLNFLTTDESLMQHFKGCGKAKYATVATKKDTNNPGGKLSMGYGFVQYFHKKSADKALKTLQQSVLDGKSLELKRSERTLKNDVKTAKKPTKAGKQTGSKILVRNVPFQANRKEISELFSTFGEIKALRLPKKMTPGADSHRGFAFVDYVTATDAKGAFEALSQSTHLYGRRLVLEWATTEEGVDEIRKRTADHFGTIEVVKSKKSVFNIE